MREGQEYGGCGRKERYKIELLLEDLRRLVEGSANLHWGMAGADAGEGSVHE